AINTVGLFTSSMATVIRKGMWRFLPSSKWNRFPRCAFYGGSLMTVNTRAMKTEYSARSLDIVGLYHTMLQARVMNDLLKTRKTQGRFPFYIGCGGHESTAAVVAALNDDDWLALYYRDLGAWLQRTGDLYGPLREAYSRTTGPMG